MKKAELAYLAGFFDGEGCVSLHLQGKWRQYMLSCIVTTAGEYMPRLFQFHFGGTVQHRKQKPAKLEWHDYWKWTIVSRQAADFLKTILPYLKLKRPQAELAIAFQDRLSARYPRGKLTEEELACREAQAILMKDLKRQSYNAV